jgi:hypothetical protein
MKSTDFQPLVASFLIPSGIDREIEGRLLKQLELGEGSDDEHKIAFRAGLGAV